MIGDCESDSGTYGFYMGFAEALKIGTMGVSLDLRFGLRAGLLWNFYPCVLNTRAVA